MAFVMVLSYSRCIFMRFVCDARMDSFLRGHIEAFAACGSVARVLLYDNPKSAVLERVGDAVRLTPELLVFAAHHRSLPVPGHHAVGDLGWAHMDAHHVGDLSASIHAAAAWHTSAAAVAQAGNELAAQLASGLGIDARVYRLVRDVRSGWSGCTRLSVAAICCGDHFQLISAPRSIGRPLQLGCRSGRAASSSVPRHGVSLV